MKYLTLWILKLFAVFIMISPSSTANFDLKALVPGQVYHSPPRDGMERLSVYCYTGIPKKIFNFWQTVRLVVNIDGDKYETYIDHTSEDVLQAYEARRSSWSWNLPFWRKAETLFLNPFNSSCIGISTKIDHSIYLHVIRIDFWRVFLFAAGVSIFTTASKLSSNPIFYYSCGVSFGVSMSFLIALYFLSKLIPKRPAVYGFLAGGWAVSVYLLQMLWSNVKTIAQVYQHYVLAYFTIAGFISFVLCYRYGPVSNPRTISLIRWTLQSFGLLLVFFSSNLTEAAAGAVILLVLYNILPASWFWRGYGFWLSKFPKKRKLLTDDEYHDEGVRETAKALAELRTYCSSPECNQWKTIGKLTKPKRFASFIEGESHLSDEELIEYETDWTKPEISDDSDDEIEP